MTDPHSSWQIVIGIAIAVFVFVVQEHVRDMWVEKRFRRRFAAALRLRHEGLSNWLPQAEERLKVVLDDTTEELTLSPVWGTSFDNMDDVYANVSCFPPRLMQVALEFHEDFRRFEQVQKAYNQSWLTTVLSKGRDDVRWRVFQAINKDLVANARQAVESGNKLLAELRSEYQWDEDLLNMLDYQPKQKTSEPTHKQAAAKAGF